MIAAGNCNCDNNLNDFFIQFDVHLKELKQAELKVLLIVIRQTLGWADRRGMLGRKEMDWISGSQRVFGTSIG